VLLLLFLLLLNPVVGESLVIDLFAMSWARWSVHSMLCTQVQDGVPRHMRFST